MKKYLRAVTGVLIAVMATMLYLVFRPISYQVQEDAKQSFMAVALTKPILKYDKKANKATGDIEMKSYRIPEQEVPELKSEILEQVCQLKYYRTPATLMNNIKREIPVYQTEGSVWITLARTQHLSDSGEYNFSAQDCANDIIVSGKYIIVHGTMYSLGIKGEEKAARLYDKIETLLKEKADGYLEK